MQSVSEVLKAVKLRKLSLNRAEKLLKLDAIAIVGEIARLDYNRYIRRGVPEIVYSQNKTVEQLKKIVSTLAAKNRGDSSRLPIILSKVREDQIEPVEDLVKSKARTWKLVPRYFRDAGLLVITAKNKNVKAAPHGKVALLAAGTSDMSALNEAEVVLNLFGCRTLRFNDVGVAGLHRLVQPLREISKFDPDVIIVAAGMEGALPSVIAGLSSVPVIGLPTSVGYGYGGRGESALMSMLQACSLGISVVNIDGGVAAGVVAWLIAKRRQR